MRLFAIALVGSALVVACDRSSRAAGAADNVAQCLSRVREIHGAAGPWAVVGYRIGRRALEELKLPRQSFSILVIHRSPAQVQYSCIADGLQAATGASVGKLNLRLEKTPLAELSSIVEDRKTGRRLTFTLQPALAKSITDLPHDKLEAAGKRVAELPDDDIFRFTESKAAEQK